jgi:2'-5' RNA ligase
VRLFTAALPPAHIADHLAVALDGVSDVKWVPQDSWHITIGYYGTDDPVTRKAWVRDRIGGLAAPRVSLSGTGNFGDTLLVKVSTPDSSLAELAAALRWSDKHPDYQPHLTIGRGEPLDLAYSGPEWMVNEVVLLGAAERYQYTVLDRYELT